MSCRYADRCADTGSELRIDEIEIEREMEAGSTVAGYCDGVAHDVAKAAFVDVTHR